MRNSRDFNSLRDISVTKDYCPGSYGSVLFQAGNTGVICAVSLSREVPEHAAAKGNGWLSAEYTMLPYSTTPRIKREFMKRDGRSVEIQRLIGRSLRRALDLAKIEGFFLEIDCDVLSADGGTRTAAISGSYIALKLALKRMLAEGLIPELPLIDNVAAVSVGYVDNRVLLDLDFSEDRNADVDMNIVMNSSHHLIEVQGAGEGSTFTREQLQEMIDLAEKGIDELVAIQNSV
jgi:ribonuclease PH